MGRRAHRPDERGRRQVEALAAYDVPELAVARVVGIDAKALSRRTRPRQHQGVDLPRFGGEVRAWVQDI
jgi:hypothetical protein